MFDIFAVIAVIVGSMGLALPLLKGGEKLLIKLNLAAGALLLVALIASPLLPIARLTTTPLVLAFAALFFANLGGALVLLLKQHRLRSFLPLMTYCSIAPFVLVGAIVADASPWSGTPSDPNSFLTAETRRNLEHIARQLLGKSFKDISIHPSAPAQASMVEGHFRKEIPPEISDQLRHYGFERVHVDDSLSLVVFSQYHGRTWTEYLYSPKELLPPAVSPVGFSDADIRNWNVLRRIIEQDPQTTVEQGSRIGYEYLRDSLGEGVLEEIRASPKQVTPAHRHLVLDALNKQRQASSRLIEHPMITFADHSPEGANLHLGGCQVSNGFWVSSLIKKLLDKGTLLYADDGRHLKIKNDISQEESRAVEWVHVGLMRSIYGDLIDRREHRYSKSLGDGWYLNRW